jgi:hypothetical protein
VEAQRESLPHGYSTEFSTNKCKKDISFLTKLKKEATSMAFSWLSIRPVPITFHMVPLINCIKTLGEIVSTYKPLSAGLSQANLPHFCEAKVATYRFAFVELNNPRPSRTT